MKFLHEFFVNGMLAIMANSKCYSESIFIRHVSDITRTFVCVFVKLFASVIFKKFQPKFSERYVE